MSMKIRITVIIALILFPLAGYAALFNNDGTINTDRPNPPKSWNHSTYKDTQVKPPMNIDMTWHHIVPYDSLSSFWDSLVRHMKHLKGKTYGTMYMKMVRSYFNLIGIPKNLEGKIINSIYKNNFQTILSQNAAGGQTVAEFLIERIAWQTWNIVEGPLNTDRTDDPDEKLDNFTQGLQQEDRDRIRVLNSFYYKIQTFNGAEPGQALDEQLIRSLANIIAGIRTKRGRELIMFDINMWERDGSHSRGGYTRSRWKKKR